MNDKEKQDKPGCEETEKFPDFVDENYNTDPGEAKSISSDKAKDVGTATPPGCEETEPFPDFVDDYVSTDHGEDSPLPNDAKRCHGIWITIVDNDVEYDPITTAIIESALAARDAEQAAEEEITEDHEDQTSDSDDDALPVEIPEGYGLEDMELVYPFTCLEARNPNTAGASPDVFRAFMLLVFALYGKLDEVRRFEVGDVITCVGLALEMLAVENKEILAKRDDRQGMWNSDGEWEDGDEDDGRRYFPKEKYVWDGMKWVGYRRWSI
jgi:hypothetical protein